MLASRQLIWTGVVLLIVLTVSVSWSTQFDRFKQIQTNDKITIAELRDKEETLNLAIEFGFDPMIVQITRRLSEDTIRTGKHNPLTWRFVRTERDLTYLVLSIIQTESRGDYRAYNQSGASGLTQLLLSTAREYDKDVKQDELFTIPKQLTIAMAHFTDLLEKYKGNYTLAVLAWNRGSGAVDRSIALGNSPENGYAQKVFEQAALRNAQ